MGSPILYWVRRDFRLGDNAVLTAAVESGRPVIPVFILDEVVEAHGAAPKWRLGLGAEQFAQRLEAIGSRLIFRRGSALEVLCALIEETGAGAVWWTRAYDPDARARDTAVKAALKERDIDAQSFPGHLLHEPWAAKTKDGGYYKVYSPFWRAVKDLPVDPPLKQVGRLPAPQRWPESDDIADWGMGKDMNRGAKVVRPWLSLGEEAARGRLGAFIAAKIDAYKARRDFPGEEATSGLSENLTYGEISPRTIWHAGYRALEEGKAGAEHFLKELVWREFAYHLVYHTPHITSANWREGWERFPWNEDERRAEVKAWKRGRTGIPFVDAGLREMYVTGTMHNRTRMIVASYLTKHLMCHWKIGMKWFEDCLVDWDPASNAMGWQWVAGSGPDAAPYFRVFNPVTQLDKFDEDRAYANRWIAEGQKDPPQESLSYFEAIPRRWNMSAENRYPDPIVTAADGRAAALAAYENRDF